MIQNLDERIKALGQAIQQMQKNGTARSRHGTFGILIQKLAIAKQEKEKQDAQDRQAQAQGTQVSTKP